MHIRYTMPLLWLWLPLAAGIIQAVIEVALDTRILEIIHSEYGPHELLEFIIITIAAVIAARIFFQMDRASNRWLTAWIGIAAFCCFYVSIEEMSWGQTVLRWNTPEFWAQVNVQDETNLHNTSTWLNQKPRILLEIGVAVGGLLIPCLRRYRPQWLPQRFAIIYPPSELTVTAGIFGIVKLLNLISHHIFDIRLFARPSEIGELFMYYFVLLYMMAMAQRLLPVRMRN